MATIIKRKKAYSVVYNYTDENGKTKQKWETWYTQKEALKRKAEIENGQLNGVFCNPTNMTIEEFMHDFVTMYGESQWGVSTYDSNTGLIANYINPIIGQTQLQDFNARAADKYIQILRKTPPVSSKWRKPKGTVITDATISNVVRLLRCAFNQAVRWEIIGKNPFDSVNTPKPKYKKREIWTAEIISQALNACTDTKLYLAMNLSFACSCRIGEILGLTWDNVFISDEHLVNDDAHIVITQELERCSKRAIDMLGEKDIIHIFTPLKGNTSTRLVLKHPKTESSNRKIWLPKTLAHILREWEKSQKELKNFLGNEYEDYGLVIAQSNGKPCERRIIEKSFQALKEQAGLPNVVFHSLRHSSTTYKLKLNNGDLKATQGDTGHAELDMITKVYAHILDEDRKVNAQKFEASFYSNPDLRAVSAPKDAEKPSSSLDLSVLLQQLQQNPELTKALASLLASQ
ncbi:MAG: site-specific integrase [Chloroflexi bacterium]|nr:site-specific integrase [Chloroflexota bacterium]